MWQSYDERKSADLYHSPFYLADGFRQFNAQCFAIVFAKTNNVLLYKSATQQAMPPDIQPGTQKSFFLNLSKIGLYPE
jgi:hypothetical protein